MSSKDGIFIYTFASSLIKDALLPGICIYTYIFVLFWHVTVIYSQGVSQERQYKRQSGFPCSETGVRHLGFWQRIEERKNSLQQSFTITASAALLHGSYPVSCKHSTELKN